MIKRRFQDFRLHLSSASSYTVRIVSYTGRVGLHGLCLVIEYVVSYTGRITRHTGRVLSYTVHVYLELMHQLLVLRVVPLCRDLLTRPNVPKPQLSCIGSLTWYGNAISTL